MQAFCEGFKLLLVLTKKLTGKGGKYTRNEKESGIRDRPHPTCSAYSSSLLEIVSCVVVPAYHFNPVRY
jgi:hypothetical protein